MSGPVKEIYMTKEKPLQKSIASTWLFNFYVFQHLCKNCSLFKNTYAKSINFVIAVRQIIRTNRINIMAISLIGSNGIKLHNIVFTL